MSMDEIKVVVDAQGGDNAPVLFSRALLRR